MSVQDTIQRLKDKYKAAGPAAFTGKQLILSRRNPEAIIRILPVGDDWFPIIGVHSITKKSTGRFSTFLCPTLTEEKESGFVKEDNCPICAIAAQLTGDKDSVNLTPKTRVAIKVIEFRVEDKFVPNEIKYLIVPVDVGGQLLDHIGENPDIVSPNGGMLIRVTKHYDTQYPTYSFEIIKAPDGSQYVIDITTDRAKEFVKANDIQIEDALPIATEADVKDIVTDTDTSFVPPTTNNATTDSSYTFNDKTEVANGSKKSKSSYDAFMQKIQGG